MVDAVSVPEGAQVGRPVGDDGPCPDSKEEIDASASCEDEGDDEPSRDGWLAGQEACRLRYREHTVRLNVLARLMGSTLEAVADVEHFDAALHGDAVERVLDNCDKVLSLVRRELSGIFSVGWPEAPGGAEEDL